MAAREGYTPSGIVQGNNIYASMLYPSGDTTSVTDTAAMQANENAGKNTRLAPGTYYVKGLVKKAGCFIFGYGAKLKLPAASLDDIIIGDQFASLTTGVTTAGIHDFGILGVEIDGNKANQTFVPPTVNQSNFNLSASFTMVLSSTASLPSTGTLTVRTLSGPATVNWSANDTGTNTLTCSSISTGRVSINTPVYTSGFGIRFFGRRVLIRDVQIHDCVADGMWSEWGSGAVGAPSNEMESRFEDSIFYGNGRYGHANAGPHDAISTGNIYFRNGYGGLCNFGRATTYHTNLHGWGAPQVISFEEHNGGSSYSNCTGEVSAVSGSRAWLIYAPNVQVRGGACLLSTPGSGGQVGVEITNNSAGCDIDTMWYGGNFANGAVLFTTSGGNNRVRGVVNAQTSPMVAGTQAVSDVVDLHAGSGTTARTVSDTLTKRAVVPSDHSFVGWAFDPAACAGTTAPTSGAIQYVRVKAIDTTSVTNLWIGIGTAGSSLTSCLLGLYDSTGAQLAVSGDQSGAWVSTGAKSATITSTPVTAGSIYYVGILAVGTPPALMRGFSAVAAAANAGYTAAPFRFNQGATGQTTLPSSFTPGSLTVALAWWAGMS